MIKQWQSGWFGKQIQQSAMGAIKSKLKSLQSVSIIERSFPTTRFCYNCGALHDKLPLSERVFKCDCGLVEDRDVKAAKTVLYVGKHKIPGAEYISTPLENQASIQIESDFNLDKLDSLKEAAIILEMK